MKTFLGCMIMFYDRFVELCNQKGVSPSRAAIDSGLSKSTVTKWKNEPDSKPTGNVIDKLTRYFGITISELLQAPHEETEIRMPTDSEMKFALFGGDGHVTDAMYDEVRSFAQFVMQREAARRRDKNKE